MDFYANPIVATMEYERRVAELRASINNRPDTLPLSAHFAAWLGVARHRLAHQLHGGSHNHSPGVSSSTRA